MIPDHLLKKVFDKYSWVFVKKNVWQIN